MASVAAGHRATPEEYLAYERGAATKSEYINGCIVAMSGASREHNLIAGNVLRDISLQLMGRSCEAYGSDMRVKVSETGLYTYPDVVVACGEIQFEDAAVDTLRTPTLIVEVLSPSTEAYDRGAKFAHYRRVPSMQEYVLVAQDRVLVEHYRRQGEQWLLTEFRGRDAVAPLPTLGIDLALRRVYDKVRLPADGE